jgi:hypothetical protein
MPGVADRIPGGICPEDQVEPNYVGQTAQVRKIGPADEAALDPAHLRSIEAASFCQLALREPCEPAPLAQFLTVSGEGPGRLPGSTVGRSFARGHRPEECRRSLTRRLTQEFTGARHAGCASFAPPIEAGRPSGDFRQRFVRPAHIGPGRRRLRRRLVRDAHTTGPADLFRRGLVRGTHSWTFGGPTRPDGPTRPRGPGWPAVPPEATP